MSAMTVEAYNKILNDGYKQGIMTGFAYYKYFSDKGWTDKEIWEWVNRSWIVQK